MSINDQLGAQLRYQTTDLSRSDFLNYHHRNKTLVAHGPSGPVQSNMIGYSPGNDTFLFRISFDSSKNHF